MLAPTSLLAPISADCSRPTSRRGLPRQAVSRSHRGCHVSASSIGRREAISRIALPAILFTASPAQAANFDKYIRGRKLPPLDSVLNPVLFSAEVLAKLEELLAKETVETLDAEEVREFLRLGPFSRFRDNLRSVAKIEGGEGTPAMAEDALLSLNALDADLVAFKKTEDAAVKGEALDRARRDVVIVREKVAKVVDLALKKVAAEDGAAV